MHHRQSMERAMTATDNKRLMEKIFAGAAVGDRTLYVDSLADDVTMTVTGQYSWSQTFHGKESVLRDLYGYVASLLKQRRTVPFRFIADDEWVAVEARGDMVTHTGERYDNHYCLIYRIENGKIHEIREYQDSTLCERVLGPFPEARKQAAG
jgi:ketosteroid isomerase-like protein